MYRRPRPEPKRPQHVPASIAMMAEHEFEDRPFGVVGEFATPGPRVPPPPVPQPIMFPAPDWDEEERERQARERAAEEEKARKLLADKAEREDAQQ